MSSETRLIHKGEAAAIVRAKLREYELSGSPPLVLLDDKTLTRPFGWVFFYQSKRFLESGKPTDALAGNAPIIVDIADGSLHLTGTAHPVSHYIREYEKQKQVQARLGRPHCPRCGNAFSDDSRLVLALTVRLEDGLRVCEAIWSCAECGTRSWRWNDRPSDPLSIYPG